MGAPPGAMNPSPLLTRAVSANPPVTCLPAHLHPDAWLPPRPGLNRVPVGCVEPGCGDPNRETCVGAGVWGGIGAGAVSGPGQVET